MTVIILTNTALSTWTVPSDWSSSNNSIECIGPGYDGANGGTGSNTGGDGGGGGAYAKVSNVSLTPGTNVEIRIGDRSSTLSTYLKNNAGTKVVEAAAANGATPGAAGSSTGDVKYSGGAGGTSSGHGGGGGGGAAGPSGAGKAGGAKISGRYPGAGGGGSNGGSSSAGSSPPDNTIGGAGGNGTSGTGGGAGGTVAGSAGTVGGGGGGGLVAGGTGGAGGMDTCFDATHGAGGGGAGGSGSSSVSGTNGGAGGGYGAGGGGGGRGVAGGGIGGQATQGIIVITYTATTSVPITGVAASPAAGTITPTGGASVQVTGAAASPNAGVITVSLRLSVPVTGVAASPAAGAITPTGAARVAPTGAAASPAAGSPTAKINSTVTLIGNAAAAAIGALFTSGAFDRKLIDSPDEAAQFLIEIVAYQGSSAASGGVETIAEIPLASFPPGSAVARGPVTIRYADRDWIGEPTDALQPNVFYEGRATVPLIMEANAPLYPELDRRVQRQFGLIEMLNSDGEFDDIIQSLSVDGRNVTVKIGPYMAPYADFAVIASMLGSAWQPGEDAVSVVVQDQVYTLDLPVQTNLYAGGGGKDGTTDIQGKPKPLCYGEVKNITPVFLDPLNLIYQVHDGQVQSVDMVYDRGGQIPLDTGVGTGGDVANYAALVAATVTASKFATCKALGLFKLGSSPAGVITADVKGDVTGGVYTNTLDGIALRILDQRTNISASIIDSASFAAAASLGGPMGIYIGQNETPTGAQVIDELVGSVGGWWGAAIDGKVKAGRIRSPETTSPDWYFDKYDILTITPDQKPIPRWRQRVAYAPNYTVQRGEDLDVSVTDARRQFLIEPYSIVTQSSATLQIRHPIAQDPPVLQTLLVNQSDAQRVCDFLQELYGLERQIFRIVTKRIGLIVNLGDCINFTYPRFGLDGGKNFIVIGRRLDMDKQEVELTLWG